MRLDEVSNEIRTAAFEFFYWFSRFEFALKECQYLLSNVPGNKAQVNWQSYIDRWKDDYTLSESAAALVAANPERQVIGTSGIDLEFVPLTFNLNASDLERIVRLAQAVRNNLFHGGKHGSNYWDDSDRLLQLLPMVISVLNELAEQTDLEADYRRYY